MAWFNDLFTIYLDGASGATKKQLAKFKNAVVFQNQFQVLLQDALNRYHFEGLPDTVSERVILESLVWYGSVCFFEKDGGLLALPCVPDGSGFNIYGDVGSVWVFARNGVFNKNVKTYIHGSDEDKFLNETNGQVPGGPLRGVCVWENSTRYPFINHTIFYSQAISDTLRALDVCRENLKRPYLIGAPESVVPTIQKTMDDKNDNLSYIVSSGIYKVSDIQVFPLTQDSSSLDAVTELIEWYQNKYRELCGIENNSQIDKKGENLINAEIDVNDEYTDSSIDKIIPYIQLGLDDVNKIYHTDIKVVSNYTDRKKNEVQSNKLDSKGADDVSNQNI